MSASAPRGRRRRRRRRGPVEQPVSRRAVAVFSYASGDRDPDGRDEPAASDPDREHRRTSASPRPAPRPAPPLPSPPLSSPLLSSLRAASFLVVRKAFGTRSACRAPRCGRPRRAARLGAAARRVRHRRARGSWPSAVLGPLHSSVGCPRLPGRVWIRPTRPTRRGRDPLSGGVFAPGGAPGVASAPRAPLRAAGLPARGGGGGGGHVLAATSARAPARPRRRRSTPAPRSLRSPGLPLCPRRARVWLASLCLLRAVSRGAADP